MLEGTLSKWTNVMKGWQYRWFVLDENAGLLSYYTVSYDIVFSSLTTLNFYLNVLAYFICSNSTLNSIFNMFLNFVTLY